MHLIKHPSLLASKVLVVLVEECHAPTDLSNGASWF